MPKSLLQRTRFKLEYNAWGTMKKIELELIPGSQMSIFFEKGSRGEIFYISNNYRKASNKYLKPYDPKQESKHIIYTQMQMIYMVMPCLNFF